MDLSLASNLRSTREARGLTLEDVAHATRIPVPRLRQLEEGNLAAFGNMAYARGFIRIYSRYLNIEADSFVKALPQPILGGAQDYRYLTESLGPWIDSRVRSSSYGQRQDSASPSARGVYALVIFLVLGVCSAVLAHNFLFPHQPAGVQNKTASAPKPTVSVAKPTATGAQVPFSQTKRNQARSMISLAEPESANPPRVMRATPVVDDVDQTKVPQ